MNSDTSGRTERASLSTDVQAGAWGVGRGRSVGAADACGCPSVRTRALGFAAPLVPGRLYGDATLEP